MKKHISTLLLLLSIFTIHADVGLHIDTQGNLIHPDDYLLESATKADKKGFHEFARNKYIQSAKFGNKNAKYIIAMNYIQNKDFANGYAWLRLINDNFLDVKTIRTNIESIITDSELQSSNSIFQTLEESYSDVAALERREKWEKSIKITGSHLRGISRSSNNVKIYYDSFGQTINHSKLLKDVFKFKYEYENIKTDIKMGEIIIIDKKG